MGRIIPHILGKIKNVWNHQPDRQCWDKLYGDVLYDMSHQFKMSKTYWIILQIMIGMIGDYGITILYYNLLQGGWRYFPRTHRPFLSLRSQSFRPRRRLSDWIWHYLSIRFRKKSRKCFCHSLAIQRGPQNDRIDRLVHWCLPVYHRLPLSQ
jgi:hypothetical protein